MRQLGSSPGSRFYRGTLYGKEHSALCELNFDGFYSRQSITFREREFLGKNNLDKLLVAKALNFEELIAYQEGSVVSRTIIDKKVGTVTIFGFDQNQSLSEHTAPYDALVYVLDGEVEVTISGKSVSLKKGEATIIPANQPHSLNAKTRFKMLLTMIKS
jgi:quercetin dioxygenase-like cupin family protein